MKFSKKNFQSFTEGIHDSKETRCGKDFTKKSKNEFAVKIPKDFFEYIPLKFFEEFSIQITKRISKTLRRIPKFLKMQ